MTERLPCKCCETEVLQTTLKRYGGYCRRCVRRRRDNRTGAIVATVFAIAWAVWWWIFESQLSESIANGTPQQVHRLIALIYNQFGIVGTRVFFGLMVFGIGGLAVFLTSKWLRLRQAMKSGK